MKTTLLKLFGAFALMILVGMVTSCDKADEATDVENFVQQATYEIEGECSVGARGCYELIFPVTLEFADGTTAVVNSNEEMRDAIRTWYLENPPTRPRPANRPTIQMPFDVINAAGEIITIETPEQLRELRQACIAQGGPGMGNGDHHGHRPRACFKPVFPFTIEFPDGVQVTVNNPEELRLAVREWHLANPDVRPHPVFVFPITVELRDGTQVVVNSADELHAIKLECRNNG